MKYAVVTGTTRGLGASLSKKMIKEGVHLISVSRSENDELKVLAKEWKVTYRHYFCDLLKTDEIENVFHTIFNDLHQQKAETIYVVNNAGVVEPIDTVGRLNNKDVKRSFDINVVSPVIIANVSIQKANEYGMKLTIANITSGAGSRPIHGWSVYGSTKAAINLFTQVTSVELTNQQLPHRMVALSPGVMDTDMQDVIRSSSKEAFIDVSTYRHYKEQGMLRHPAQVAEAFVTLLLSGNFTSGRIYHVRELES